MTVSAGTGRNASVEILDTQGQWKSLDGLLLEVDQLQVEFRTRDGVAKAINGVSFDLREGETLAILGEIGDRAGDHGHPRYSACFHHWW